MTMSDGCYGDKGVALLCFATTPCGCADMGKIWWICQRALFSTASSVEHLSALQHSLPEVTPNGDSNLQSNRDIDAASVRIQAY